MKQNENIIHEMCDHIGFTIIIPVKLSKGYMVMIIKYKLKG